MVSLSASRVHQLRGSHQSSESAFTIVVLVETTTLNDVKDSEETRCSEEESYGLLSANKLSHYSLFTLSTSIILFSDIVNYPIEPPLLQAVVQAQPTPDKKLKKAFFCLSMHGGSHFNFLRQSCPPLSRSPWNSYYNFQRCRLDNSHI